MTKEPKRYLSAESMTADDFGVPFTMQPGELVYDAMTKRADGRGGPFATMTHASYTAHGLGKLGLGFGQKYQRNSEGHLVKVEG